LRIVAVVLLAGAVWLAGCSTGGPRRTAPPSETGGKAAAPQAPKKKPAEESIIKAEFQKAEMTWADENGVPVWKAQFKEATASQTGESAVVELRGVKASLYRNGKVASSLVAPRVVADSRSKEVRASGGVKITSAVDGATARCERIVWKSQEDRIIGVGAVKMIRGNLTVTARSFEADTTLNKARFTEAELSLD